MEESWLIFLGIYAFSIAYAIYFLFTYKVDPRFSLKYKKTPSFSRLLGLSILEKTLFLLLLVFLSMLPGRKMVEAFSLGKLDFSLNGVCLGVLGGFFVFLAGMPISWLVSMLRRKFSFPKTKREEELMRLLRVSMPHSLTELFIALLLTSVSAAILEEVIFRGYLLNHLLLVIHPALAITVQAFLFFFPHLYQGIYNALLPLFSGFVFGLTFYFTNSLFTVIVSHFTADFIGLLLTVNSMRKRG